MSVRVILELRAKPGAGDELVAFFGSILPDTRAYAGCTSAEALRSRDDADHVVVVEVWDSHEHYDQYLAWQRDRGTTARLMEALAEPPSIRRFDETGA